MSLRKNTVITGTKINSKIDLEDFAKLTKCMVMHLVNFLPGLKSFKIAEEERLAIHKNLTVDSVMSGGGGGQRYFRPCTP